ncbi:bifunctional DNA-formamidopyrimidine glycosylase/DNA-(apurinic or apyrimidinic site) lyase [Gynuella sunshinyii]|uniref:Formamidopyrimidine-DNA glycosylase n=1 Tax=Gynuella sunshinyii YC6258 TaxID=1445510 RepID=A0A0C5VF01_9GAMM|nr:bifunctional DNA-formamidopyrimidine glycosylase/DNA-(apurinic or apyrimidinic site) lyase [Gynuella sunshinyii]AJQ93137.1 formamidopyrimidine-DNA glycosylase [Gynuella sunshinyii YC6258]
MPELPEVETTRRGLEPHIVGQQVLAVVIRNAALRWPVPTELPSWLEGQRLLRIERRAKYLLFRFEQGTVLAHLGMSGSMRILSQPMPPEVHDHVELSFGNGSVLRYNDPRRFGAWLYYQEPDEEHFLLNRLGPEPLSEAFDGDRLFALSRKKKQAVKLFLMDNHVVVGVGNIYANEALFRAGIRPAVAAGRITRSRYQLLAQAVKTVLQQAIVSGGTTLKDFVNSDGKPGYFAQQLNVYGRGSLPCKQCAQLLKEIRLGGRTSVYCPQCQQ